MKIAILGYGVEGESVYNYYRTQFPDAEFVAYDNKAESKRPIPDGVTFVGGVSDFKNIEADLAIKTPPIPPWEVEVTGAVTTMTREFMKHCPAPIIGVTGTKGKGTTSSLIKSILDAAGKRTWLVGNIGLGAFDVLNQISPGDIVIYELSSFQLWDADVSPHVAVVLGIEPEHLDVHKDFDDYIAAKSHIALYQTADDTVVYNATNEHAKKIAGASSAHKVPYLDSAGVYLKDNYFFFGDDQLLSADVMGILGEHNKQNACAAIAAAWEWVSDPEIIKQGLSRFTGLPYRIQKIREFEGVSYYNDSYSASPSATNVALDAMKAPTILIAGGYDRGRDYSDFSATIRQHSHVKKVLLIGQTSQKIAAGLPENLYELCASLEEAVTRAATLADDGDTVLLSPGCASFDMFKDFNDRGQKFTDIVGAL